MKETIDWKRMNSQVLSAPCRVQTRCPSVVVITEAQTCEARSWWKLMPSRVGRSSCQGSEVARFSVTAALCSVTPHFLQTLEIYGVVNNDLILFSMLVIYFRIYILVSFRLWSICFALLWLQGFKQCFSGVPSRRTRAVYLMLWITFSKCLIF